MTIHFYIWFVEITNFVIMSFSYETCSPVLLILNYNGQRLILKQNQKFLWICSVESFVFFLVAFILLYIRILKWKNLRTFSFSLEPNSVLWEVTAPLWRLFTWGFIKLFRQTLLKVGGSWLYRVIAFATWKMNISQKEQGG